MPPQSPQALRPAATAPADGPAQWDDVVRVLAEQEGVPVPLALAVGRKESSLNPDAIGDGGQAVGMFQLHPAAAADVGLTEQDRSDPIKNIKGGLGYLKQLNARYGGDVNKVLQAYNGGMANVDAGTVSPQAQAYAATVIAELSKNIRESSMGGPSAPAAPANVRVQPGVAAPPAKPQGSIAGDFLGGLRATAAKTVFGGGDLIRRGAQSLGLPVARIIDDPDVQAAMTAPDSAAGTAGQFAGEVAEFAIPAGAITKSVKGLQVAGKLIRAGVSPGRAKLAAAAVEGSAQAAGAAGISVLNREDPTAAAIASAAMPIAAQMITSMAPAIRRAATTRMARFMERGVRGMVTPELEKTIAQAANDFIDLPLQRTWRQTARLTSATRREAGQDLGAALAGPLGDTPVPVTPVIKALDDLVSEAQHIVPAGQGQFRTQTFKPGVVEAVGDLKGLLDEYDTAYKGLVPARMLHDLKQVWWRTVYPLKESANPISSTRELLTTAQKEAHLRGAAAISKVFESKLPDLAALDQAVSHAARMDQFVKKLAIKARTSTLAKPQAKYATGAMGGALGVAVGSTLGHPIIGAHIGYATARMLISAIESPQWRLLPVAARRRLADSLARGDAETARKILAPTVAAATADQDDLVTHVQQPNNPLAQRSPSASR